MNALSRGLEQALLERGIPYRMVRGVAYYERREIKDVLSALRLAVNPRDATALERIANVPARGLGPKKVSELSARLAIAEGEPADIWNELANSPPFTGASRAGAARLARLMLAVAGAETLAAAVNSILYNEPEDSYRDFIVGEYPDDFEERLENIQEIVSIMPEGNISDALAQVSLFTELESPEAGGSRVNLLTLHAAKGLEFPVVFVAGMEEGVFPSSRALDDEPAIEEERRLCYVGMTRARERLYMSGARSRLLFGSVRRAMFSRFVTELPAAVETDDRTGRGSDFDVRRGGHGRNWRW
jgi:DNA helicase-2/ATP-dependent DNA helicase PcrA